MSKKQKEQQNRQKNLNQFNSITQKVKPENQNQGHNVRSEAVEPKKRQRYGIRKGAFFVSEQVIETEQ